MKTEKVKIFGYMLLGAGMALLGEHVINYGYTEWELFGHETYGLIAIIIAFIILLKKPKKKKEAEYPRLNT